MRNPESYPASSPTISHDVAPELVYANDVQVIAEPGGLQLTFIRPRTATDSTRLPAHDEEVTTEIIARVVLPPLAAKRLLRLLPRRLDLQQVLAEEYARITDAEFESDPLLVALADAEDDDEPYTDEQKAAAQAGREAFARGEFATLDEVWREIVDEDNPSTASPS